MADLMSVAERMATEQVINTQYQWIKEWVDDGWNHSVEFGKVWKAGKLLNEACYRGVRYAWHRLMWIHLCVIEAEQELDRDNSTHGYGRQLEDDTHPMPRAQHVSDEEWMRESTYYWMMLEAFAAAKERKIMEGSLRNLRGVIEYNDAEKAIYARGGSIEVWDPSKDPLMQPGGLYYDEYQRQRGRGRKDDKGANGGRGGRRGQTRGGRRGAAAAGRGSPRGGTHRATTAGSPQPRGRGGRGGRGNRAEQGVIPLALGSPRMGPQPANASQPGKGKQPANVQQPANVPQPANMPDINRLTIRDGTVEHGAGPDRSNLPDQRMAILRGTPRGRGGVGRTNRGNQRGSPQAGALGVSPYGTADERRTIIDSLAGRGGFRAGRGNHGAQRGDSNQVGPWRRGGGGGTAGRDNTVADDKPTATKDAPGAYGGGWAGNQRDTIHGGSCRGGYDGAGRGLPVVTERPTEHLYAAGMARIMEESRRLLHQRPSASEVPRVMTQQPTANEVPRTTNEHPPANEGVPRFMKDPPTIQEIQQAGGNIPPVMHKSNNNQSQPARPYAIAPENLPNPDFVARYEQAYGTSRPDHAAAYARSVAHHIQLGGHISFTTPNGTPMIQNPPYAPRPENPWGYPPPGFREECIRNGGNPHIVNAFPEVRQATMHKASGPEAYGGRHGFNDPHSPDGRKNEERMGTEPWVGKVKPDGTVDEEYRGRYTGPGGLKEG